MPRHGDTMVDETTKNRIYHLYIVENLPLDKVRSTMKKVHGFERTRNEYQKLLHDWKFDKNNTIEDWRSLKRKVGARKANHKESALYLHMKLLPDKRVKKEFGRKELFMTVIESFKDNQEPMPATPPGFSICTPGDQYLAHFAFSNLPILDFAKLAGDLAGSALQFDSGAMSLAPLFATSAINASRTDPLASILPTSAFINEEAATGLGLDRIDGLGPTEILNLTTYMISNNFPGEVKSEAIYKWLKSRGSLAALASIASVDSLTPKALLEGIFRLAVKAGDTPTVKELLKLNVNPNGHQIRHDSIVGTLNPLQYACITGSAEIAQALIEAKASIEETQKGWKKSILVFAILGQFHAIDGSFYDRVDSKHLELYVNDHEDLEDNESEHHEPTDEQSPDDGYIGNNPADQFSELIESLIEAGAKVVFSNTDEEVDDEIDDEVDDELDDWRPFPSFFLGCDSPLAAAAKFRQQHLVDRFLSLEANPNFLSLSNTSPLQECLFSLEEGCLGLDHHLREPSQLRQWMVARSTFAFHGCETITRIALSLFQAHANANDKYECDVYNPEVYYPEKCCRCGYSAYHRDCRAPSAFNMAIVGGFEDLVKCFLSKGVKINDLCLEYAVHGESAVILEWIIDAGAPLTHEAVRAAAELHRHDFFGIILAKRRDPRSRALLVIEAIRSDIPEHMLELESFDFSVLREHLPMLQEAVNDCCSTGRTGLFCKLLGSQFALREIVIATMIPSALNSLITAEVWNSELSETLMDIVENDKTLITTCSQALLSSVYRQQESIAIRLIKAGVPLSVFSTECQNSTHSGSVLIAAIHNGSDAIVQELLKSDANVNAVGNLKNGNLNDLGCRCVTPLEVAVWKGCSKTLPLENLTSEHSLFCDDPNLVRELLKRGANPFDEGAIKRSSPVDYFYIILIAALFAATRYFEVQQSFWHVIFEMAILQRDSDLAFKILERRLLDPNLMWKKCRPLYFALQSDCGPKYEFTNMLLRFGANLNVPIEPFYMGSKSPLMVAITLGDQQKVEFLLRNGAHVDIPYDLGFRCSALQHALRVESRKEMVTLLLEWKADPNFCTQHEFAPLQMAICRIMHDNKKHSIFDLQIVTLLLDHGADPNLTTYLLGYGNQLYSDHRDPWDKPYTCLQRAVEIGDKTLVKLLLNHRADPNLMPTEPSHTPLQIAARDGNKEMTEILLEYGADVNAPPCSDSGATALQFAAIGGYLGIAFLFLDYNVDVNAAGAEFMGRTALEGAAEHGRIDMIRMLLNAGVDVHGEGQTQYERALDFASNNGHHAARQMLEEHHG